ncbi:MAG: choice-of-anchor tandem repeat GloVer-containing protein, partial [Candidatus Tumulicola sp.]
MKQPNNLIGACLSASLLAACGGGNNGLPTSTILAPSQQMQRALAPSASHQVGKNAVIERVLYSFCQIASCVDGANPSAGLTNVNGTLYGTTRYGGDAFDGTVFSITASGKETVLHSFGSGSDGANPYAGLLNVNGTLYGTTENGSISGCGGLGCGTVFSITTAGTEKVLYSFAGSPDGGNPLAGLANVRGTLYGVTRAGGANSFGTIFSITKSGTYTRLYSFAKGRDGCPFAGLINVRGVLYGTTYGCNQINGHGTVFKITTSGTETLLYSFVGGSDGAHPSAGLTDVGGVLYGTTDYGGTGSCLDSYRQLGCGTVFKITTAGTETVLYSFKGGTDGANPEARLIAVNGRLYGTTSYGGAGCKAKG